LGENERGFKIKESSLNVSIIVKYYIVIGTLKGTLKVLSFLAAFGG